MDVDADMEVEITKQDEPSEVARDAEALERGLKELFGSSALTTDIEEKDDRVSVNGDGWGFVVRGDGSLVFKPGGSAYRIVRSTDALEKVENEGEGVSFVFGNEKIKLRRGVEHRA
ncbi:MAG: hypothetical protein U5J64_03055 [Halobacteriales archaeon]|nr:hypothetical protein [Halobacteriales archaeon]